MKLDKAEKSFLYQFEFGLLPKLILNLDDYFCILRIISGFICEKENFFTPYIANSKYSSKDFSTRVRKISFDGKNVDIFIIQTECPDWDNAPLCKRIFICYSKDLDNPRYFTIEYDEGKFGNEKSFFLGEVTEEGHLSYGKIEDDIEIQTDTIMNEYLNNSEEIAAATCPSLLK